MQQTKKKGEDLFVTVNTRSPHRNKSLKFKLIQDPSINLSLAAMITTYFLPGRMESSSAMNLKTNKAK